jgi:hypothetical protein
MAYPQAYELESSFKFLHKHSIAIYLPAACLDRKEKAWASMLLGISSWSLM